VIDPSIFQLMAGLRYAFPKTESLEPKYPGLVAHDKIAARPKIADFQCQYTREATQPHVFPGVGLYITW
jgi:hypothetical protein